MSLLEVSIIVFCFLSLGFERVRQEDLLPLPLKEDSNSISKSKVTLMLWVMIAGEKRLSACNENH